VAEVNRDLFPLKGNEREREREGGGFLTTNETFSGYILNFGGHL
jgi:hypothetical protein